MAESRKDQWKAELVAGYRALGLVVEYGISKYPVIIFDEKVAVYGLTDLDQAVSQYRQWLSRQEVGHE